MKSYKSSSSSKKLLPVTFVILFLCFILQLTAAFRNCTEYPTCATCVGYFYPKPNECVWCGFRGECYTKEEARHHCFEQEIEHKYLLPPFNCTRPFGVRGPLLRKHHSTWRITIKGSTSYLSYLSLLLLSACLCFCFGTCCLRRVARSALPHIPRPMIRTFLSSRDRTSVLRTAIETGVGEGAWLCHICDYDNRPKTSHCDLCGTACPPFSPAVMPGKADQSSTSHETPLLKTDALREPLLGSASTKGVSMVAPRQSSAHHHPHQLAKLTPRQRQARRRKVWTRKKNIVGEYHWERKRALISRKESGTFAIQIDDPLPVSRSRDVTVSEETPPGSPAFISSLSFEETQDSDEEDHLRMTWIPAQDVALTTSYYMRGSKANARGSEEKEDPVPDEINEIAEQPFWKKHLWFLDRLQDIQVPWNEGHLFLEVSRDTILEDSFTQFSGVRPDELLMWMKVEFIDEAGVDAGGIEREWFMILFQELFDPAFGMFILREGTYTINPSSGVANELHLEYFYFTGRLIGKALMQHQAIPVHLSLLLLKHILAQPISLSDLEFIDPQLYKSLKWLRENEKVEDLHLDFTVTVDVFGRSEVVELKEGGKGCAVHDGNKEEYLKRRLKYAALIGIEDQLSHFLMGLFEVIPYKFLSVFDYQELELLMCGLQDVDTDDWQSHTKYHGEYERLGPNHPVIKWFWEVVSSFSATDKSRFLQFCTGSARISAHGFKTLHSNDGVYREFNIQSIPKEECPFPRAHTCFNKLDLPIYSSKSELHEYLSMIVQSDVTGFSMD